MASDSDSSSSGTSPRKQQRQRTRSAALAKSLGAKIPLWPVEVSSFVCLTRIQRILRPPTIVFSSIPCRRFREGKTATGRTARRNGCCYASVHCRRFCPCILFLECSVLYLIKQLHGEGGSDPSSQTLQQNAYRDPGKQMAWQQAEVFGVYGCISEAKFKIVTLAITFPPKPRK